MIHQCWRDQTRDLQAERQPRQDQDVSGREMRKQQEAFSLFHVLVSVGQADIKMPQRSLKYFRFYTISQSII